MSELNDFLGVIAGVMIAILLFIALLGGLIFLMEKSTDRTRATYEYNLSEIDDGVYGYYNTVSSGVPAQNYEVITLYFNGSIHTLDGDVNIHYTDSEPRLVWHYVRLVHGCTYDVYVPNGSIEMRPNVGLG
jgi:hypothetical protein